MLLVEKYRPKVLTDLVIDEPNRKKITAFIENKATPHLLLCGEYGIGKTTLAQIIAREISGDEDTLFLNASKEGIDTIRDKVMSFIATSAYGDNHKTVILDEASGLSVPAQDILNNVMEAYSEGSRFILTTNSLSKISDALQSRCLHLSLKPDVAGYMRRLVSILRSENVKVDMNNLQRLEKIVRAKYPDLRWVINNVLEGDVVDGVLTVREHSIADVFITDLFSRIQNESDPYVVRRFVIENSHTFGNDYRGLLVKIIDEIPNIFSDVEKRMCLAGNVAEHLRWDAIVPDKEINFFNFTIRCKTFMR